MMKKLHFIAAAMMLNVGMYSSVYSIEGMKNLTSASQKKSEVLGQPSVSGKPVLKIQPEQKTAGELKVKEEQGHVEPVRGIGLPESSLTRQLGEELKAKIKARVRADMKLPMGIQQREELKAKAQAQLKAPHKEETKAELEQQVASLKLEQEIAERKKVQRALRESDLLSGRLGIGWRKR